MLKLVKVDNVNSEIGDLRCYVIADDTDKPLLIPSLFLLSLSYAGRSINTVQTYGSHLLSFFKMLEKSSISYREITDRQMSGYLAGNLHQSRGLSHSSVQNHIAAIESFYNFCFELGIVLPKKSFTFNYTTAPQSVRLQKSNHISAYLHKLYFSEEQFINFVLPSVRCKNGYRSERDELILCLGFYAGLRAAEIVDKRNLCIEYLRELLSDSLNKPIAHSVVLRIVGKGEKTRNIPIAPILTDRIARFLSRYFSDVQGGPLIRQANGSLLKTKKHASNVFRKARNWIVAETGDERWKKRSFHTLRHIYATNKVSWCYEHGLDPWVVVPDCLGHSDVQTTFNYIYFDAVLNNRMEV